ncbi:MAG: erythrose 4-phosphate dehydrogenase [Flavobacteriales bacterium]|nr:erythrose 4-phosphate dehydrogenase [Flavobacteriales bacterium]
MYRLGINTGFAVNRYTDPKSWCALVNKCNVNNVQLTADLINPSLPDYIIEDQINQINYWRKLYNIEISSTFTGAFTRLNHLTHPDEDIRKYWINWFKKFADITVKLGCNTMGSHFGILTTKDYNDAKTFKKRKVEAINLWHDIADYGKNIGLKQIIWEPMSVGREFGETIEKCAILQHELNENAPIPFKICLDVDHGDISSNNSDDYDPYKWLEAFSQSSPVIHLKQSSANKNGHWPFTKEYNETGKIIPYKVLQILKNNKISDVDLILELSFKEREPWDSSIETCLIESSAFWRKHL